MKVLSLFSGIGGLDLAAEWAGFSPVAFVEQKPFCQSVLRRHWPDVPIFDDVRTFDAALYRGRITALIGGFPCQDVSAAGEGAGLSGERSGLWFDMLRAITLCRPRFVVVENVDALYSRGIDTVLSGLEEAGYAVEALSVAASDLGATHGRKRWFIVGEALEYTDCEPFVSQCGAGYIRPSKGSNHDDVAQLTGAALEHPDGQGWRRSLNGARDEAAGNPASCPGEAVAHADSSRQPQPGRAERNQRGRTKHSGEEVADSCRQRPQEQPREEPEGARIAPTAGGSWGGMPESRVGGAAHGLPARLDTAGRFLWPAGQGDYQHDWEAPRAIPKGQKFRAARVEALGNAVSPQQAYPIFAAIARRIKSSAEIIRKDQG